MIFQLHNIHRTPQVWILGYNPDGSELSLVLNNISSDHTNKQQQ